MLAVNLRNILRRKCDPCKAQKSCNSYRQRYHVTGLRKKSVRTEIGQKCQGTGKGFCKTVKPLFNNKCSGSVDDVLYDKEQTSYTSNEVPSVINEHFVNLARDIGQVDIIPDEKAFEAATAKHKHHSSVK